MLVEQQEAGEEGKADKVHGGHNLPLATLTFLVAGPHAHAHGLPDGDDRSLLNEGLGGRHQDIPGDKVARLHVDEVAEDAPVACWQAHA